MVAPMSKAGALWHRRILPIEGADRVAWGPAAYDGRWPIYRFAAADGKRSDVIVWAVDEVEALMLTVIYQSMLNHVASQHAPHVTLSIGTTIATAQAPDIDRIVDIVANLTTRFREEFTKEHSDEID